MPGAVAAVGAERGRGIGGEADQGASDGRDGGEGGLRRDEPPQIHARAGLIRATRSGNS